MCADDFAGCSGSDVSYNVHVWSPSGKLSLPSCNRRQGNDDQKWTILVHLVEEIGQESYSLHGLRPKRLLDIKTSCLISQKYLAKSHLIRQYTVLSFAPQISKPIEASELEVFELAARRLNVVGITGDLLEGRPALSRI